MTNGLEKILESDFLNDETKSALQEAWTKKLDEVRSSLKEEVAEELKESFKARYENDKNNLVEAMNNMLESSVKEFSAEQIKAAKDLKEEKQKLTASIIESRKEYKAKLAEHMKALDIFVLENLKDVLEQKHQELKALEEQRVISASKAKRVLEVQKTRMAESIRNLQTMTLEKLNEELKKLHKEQASLKEAKAAASKKLIEHRKNLNEETSAQLNKLNKFVIENLRKEIAEFQEEKRQLSEQRVQLAKEAKAKLEEAEKKFIVRASKLVTETIDSQMRAELTKLKEDIKTAKENRFGRKIFEQFQAEFIQSSLSNEKSKLKEMADELEATKAKLAESASVMKKQQVLVERAEKQAKFAKEDAIRTKTLNEMLRPLNKDKREIMETLLSSVKTQNLKESFNKYLPTVLNEKVSTKKNVLSEQTTSKIKEVTGNKTTRLNESARAEDGQQMAEIIEMRRLAGIE